MKDSRLQIFRAAADGLIESLEAVIRLTRYRDGESRPEPLVNSASKLLDRLGVASRLTSSKFQGTIADVRKVDALCIVMKRLDAAYLAYRQQIDPPLGGTAAGLIDAIAILETEVASTTASMSEQFARA